MSWKKLLELDATLSYRLRVAERPGFLRSLAALLAHSGDSWFWLPGLAIVWWFETGFWKNEAGIMFIGILITACLVLAVKFSVRRKRPEGEWGSMYRNTDPHSFPSGHAARAIMLAVIALGLGPAWLAWLFVVWAPLVALARVAMGLHYLSDILAGGLCGLLTGVIVNSYFIR